MNCLVKLLFVCYFVPPLSSVSLSRALFLLHLSHLPTVFFFFAFFSPFRVLTILFSHRAPNLNFQLNRSNFCCNFFFVVIRYFGAAYRLSFRFRASHCILLYHHHPACIVWLSLQFLLFIYYLHLPKVVHLAHTAKLKRILSVNLVCILVIQRHLL